jgi:hypothetical protein
LENFDFGGVENTQSGSKQVDDGNEEVEEEDDEDTATSKAGRYDAEDDDDINLDVYDEEDLADSLPPELAAPGNQR